MASNYDDVLRQLQLGGLIVEELRVGTPKPVRCRIEGDKEKRGWYQLHEIMTSKGDALIVGSFGVWRGQNNGVTKIEVRKTEFSSEQRELIRERIKEDRRRADAMAKFDAAKAAARAQAAWLKCSNEGESEYLSRKGVGAYGVRFSPSGALVIPMTDTSGVIHGLQVIRSRKEAAEHNLPEKQYWPAGLSKKGTFHLIGTPTWIVLIAEGYATGASLYAATGLPVAIAWDAGNLGEVARELRHRYRSAKILICADDDNFAKCDARETVCRARIVLTDNYRQCSHCGHDHNRVNTGVFTSSTVAVAVAGSFVMPRFADEQRRRQQFIDRGIKLTDFNDLHLAEGLHVVRVQIETRLSELSWRPPAHGSARTTPHAGEGAEKLRPIDSLNELLDNFALVRKMNGTVFDYRHRDLMSLTDMRDLCVTPELHRLWRDHHDRIIVYDYEVGFDPSEKDERITCNLWKGWPRQPVAGKCDLILQLLHHMCSADQNSTDLYNWILRWCAYPLVHHGAKMKSCVVVCGPQGAGKNMFFEDGIASIYGKEYSRVIDQDAMEDKFNDWASRKLLLIADEVLSEQKYHLKNKLKRFITGDTIRINPKNMSAYDERNHVNMVFLSNEKMPVVLEEDDRRHAVLRTPPALSMDFYIACADELKNGGVAALHHYLLTQVDLAGFTEHTRPPWTEAKIKLIDLSRDSTSRFFFELCDGDIAGVESMPCLTRHLYELYGTWCVRTGNRRAPMHQLIATIEQKHAIKVDRMRYLDEFAVEKQHTVAMIGGLPKIECPIGKDPKAWLGESVARFAKMVEDEKNRRADAA
jgi:putative DNA primase/helicase